MVPTNSARRTVLTQDEAAADNDAVREAELFEAEALFDVIQIVSRESADAEDFRCARDRFEGHQEHVEKRILFKTLLDQQIGPQEESQGEGSGQDGIDSFGIQAKDSEGDKVDDDHKVMVQRRRLFAFCDYGLFAVSMVLLVTLVVLSFSGMLTKILLAVLLPIAIICYGLSLFIYLKYRKRRTRQTHITSLP